MAESANRRSNAKHKQPGFTLIELLVVVAIISLLSSIVLTSINQARKSARDARRLADIKSLITAIEAYRTNNIEIPGKGDNQGTQITPDCNNSLKSDLLGGGYLQSMPQDPNQSTNSCDGRGPLRDDSEFFYGWDSAHCCGVEYCLSVNRIETENGIENFANAYPDVDNDISDGVQSVTGVSDASIAGADFNYCLIED